MQVLVSHAPPDCSCLMLVKPALLSAVIVHLQRRRLEAKCNREISVSWPDKRGRLNPIYPCSICFTQNTHLTVFFAGVTARIFRPQKFSGRKTSASRNFPRKSFTSANFRAQWNFSWAYSGNIPPVDIFRAGYFSQK